MISADASARPEIGACLPSAVNVPVTLPFAVSCSSRSSADSPLSAYTHRPETPGAGGRPPAEARTVATSNSQVLPTLEPPGSGTGEGGRRDRAPEHPIHDDLGAACLRAHPVRIYVSQQR